MTDEIIRLDVGGKRFHTSLSTLLTERNTFFTCMFSGAFPPKKQEDGTYFIDRDPRWFGVILNYLRGKPISLESLTEVELEDLLLEVEFYQINSLLQLLKPPPPPPPPLLLSQEPGITIIAEDVCEWRLNVTDITEKSKKVRGNFVYDSPSFELLGYEWIIRISKAYHVSGVIEPPLGVFLRVVGADTENQNWEREPVMMNFKLIKPGGEYIQKEAKTPTFSAAEMDWGFSGMIADKQTLQNYTVDGIICIIVQITPVVASSLFYVKQ